MFLVSLRFIGGLKMNSLQVLFKLYFINGDFVFYFCTIWFFKISLVCFNIYKPLVVDKLSNPVPL